MPVNLTPAHLRCSLGGCSSVHEMEDGRLRIIGKIDPSLTVNEDGSPIDPEKWDGIGQDETAIIISPDLLADYVTQVNGESLRDRAVVNEAPDGSSPSRIDDLRDMLRVYINDEAIEAGLRERDQSPKGGDGEAGSVHAGPVCEANSPEILHLRSQLAKLKQALKPFAQITPSSFFPYDGSEAEGYIVMLKGDWGNPIEFTGADIAAARAALTDEDKENV